MREMKDSGIKWIGEIPVAWSVSRYKFFSQSRMGETILEEDLAENGIPVYSATNDDKLFGYVTNARLLLHRGDLIIPARGNSIGFMKYVNHNEATCTQTTICSFNIHGIESRYLYYCNYAFKDDWYKYDGSAIPQVTVEQLKNNNLPYPYIDEQKRIADYLDEKCAKIDSIIEKQQAIIEKLKEYKLSVITEAVTKGLNPGVEMKDSGIEWIEKIPKHWNKIKLKYCSYIRARLGWKGLKADEYVEEGYPLLSAFNIVNSKIDFINNVNYISKFRYDESPEIKLNEGDILLVKDGAGIGKCGIIEYLPMPSTTNGSLAVITADNSIVPKFLYYYFLIFLFFY